MAKHGAKFFLVVISSVMSHFDCGLTLPAASCCKDSSIVLDCANCNLTVFPTDILDGRINVTTLDLSHTNISHIPDGSFQNLTSLKILKLTGNRVMNYNKETFRGLEGLEELEIGFYRKEFIVTRLPADVLIFLVGLKVLRLFYRFAKELEPSSLSTLTNLHTLQMSAPAEFHLGEEFKVLINLRSLIIIDFSEYFDMTDKSFENVPQLEELQITHALKNISRMALKGFTRLSTLSLLCNPRLQNADVFKAIKNMRGPTLTKLILDGSQHHGIFFLSSDLIDSPNFSGITHLSLKFTSLGKVDFEVAYFLFNLTYLAIGHNNFVSEHLDLSVKEMLKLLNGAKIEVLDVTGILRPSVDRKFHHKYCGSTKDTFRYPPRILNISLDEKRREVSQEDINVTSELLKFVPPSLQFLFMGGAAFASLSHHVYWAGVNNILYIDFSYGKTTRFPLLVGLDKLQGVDINNMGLRSINVQQFVKMPSLRYANLSHNNLQAMDLNMLLRGGLKLEWLDLGYNDIEDISLSFQNMMALQYLSLRGNPLSDFTLSFGNNTQLHELDLSRCLMKSLPSEVREELDYVQSQLHHQLNVDLSGNRFECSCDMLDMIKWFQNTEVNIVDRSKVQCSDKNTSVIVVEIDLQLMSKNCQRHGTLILSLTLSFVIGCTFLVSGLISYRYKWHLRFYIYKGRQRIKRLVEANEEILLDDLDTYDAFVVYEESQDYEWVENELIPKISDEWGFAYCVTRMFDGGRSVFQVCETAISSSRMIILVVTPAYATDEWCQFQMEMILTARRDRIIVICKEDIPPNNLSRTLLALMESGCLEYSQEPVALEMFWRRLYDKLRL